MDRRSLVLLVLLLALVAVSTAAAFVATTGGCRSSTATAVAFLPLSSTPDDDNDNDDETIRSWTSGSHSVSSLRRVQEAMARRFVTGDALQELRARVRLLGHELQKARRRTAINDNDNNNKNRRLVQHYQTAIYQALQMDAEYVYQQQQQQQQRDTDRTLLAAAARSVLPQFQLHGLWVGRMMHPNNNQQQQQLSEPVSSSSSSSSSMELINVTYVGDVLTAYQVTGNGGARVVVTADLCPNSNNHVVGWEPIQLDPNAAQQWGQRFLTRFAGRMQPQQTNVWVPGQLILVNNNNNNNNHQFLAMVGLPNTVFFGRPTPELTLRLLRKAEAQRHGGATDNDIGMDHHRDYLDRCMKETTLLLHDDDDDDEEDVRNGGVAHNQYNYHRDGCFE
jgi:hypothetical protein